MGSGVSEACAHLWRFSQRVDESDPAKGVLVTCIDCGGAQHVETFPKDRMGEVITFEKLLTQQLLRQRVADAVKRQLATLDVPTFGMLTGPQAVALAGAPEDRWLIADVLSKGATALLVAQHKVGKSTLCQNLLLALLEGVPFLGHRVQPYPRNVAYLNMDEPAEMFGEQLEKLLRGVPSETAARFLVSHLTPNQFDASNVDHTKALGEKCVADGIGVLVLDVWTSCYHGDENDNSSALVAMNNLKTMRKESDLDALIVIHHAGWSKESTRSRGASSIEGAVDILWRYSIKDECRMFDVPISRIRGCGEVEVVLDWDTWRITAGGADVPGSKSHEKRKAHEARLAERDAEKAAACKAAIRHAVIEGDGLSNTQIRANVEGFSTDLKVACLKEMVDAGGLTSKREGQAVIYRVPPPAVTGGSDDSPSR
jgi:hypothetical protein